MSGQTPSIGLALGGGGARGLAHIVVLEALDELGLRPVALAGTSMGAVIGAAYAAGMPARDIRTHALRVLRNRRVLLSRMLEARVGRFADIFRRGLVNPVLIDAELFLPLFWPAGISSRFEELAIPLTVIATDFDARAEVIIETGDVLSAVAASIAIPGLARPVMREGLRLIDGGTVNPLPYDRLKGRADILLACDVATGRSDEPSAGFQAIGIMLGASQIMQAALTGRMLSAHPPDLLLRPPVERVRLLDFIHASRILEGVDGWKEGLKRELAATLERVVKQPDRAPLRVS